ncbi:unnamed protein product, partial [Rotaria sp. Silwood1]
FQKKRTLSKIFNVFTGGRSGSVSSTSTSSSIPSNLANSNTSLLNSSTHEINTTQGRVSQTLHKESDKRRASVKLRQAPTPPNLSHLTTLPSLTITSAQSPSITAQSPSITAQSPQSIDSN